MPLPGRTSVERCLIRHGLVTPQARKRKRSDYKRWERSRAMELWQMDIVGGVRLADGVEAKIVSGHRRPLAFRGLRRTWWPGPPPGRCAMRWRRRCARHGAPEAILTDNGKVFTARFGPGPGPVLFDRICRDNDIKHLLTAPRSPTTTGKVERWHKTLRGEFLTGKVFEVLAEAQARLDAWVRTYNHERPHQSIGRCPALRAVQARRAPSAPESPATRRDRRDRGGGDDPTGQRQGHDQLRHRQLQGGGVAGRPDRRGACARAASCSSTTGACSSPPTPAAPGRQAGCRPAARSSTARHGRRPAGGRRRR